MSRPAAALLAGALLLGLAGCMVPAVPAPTPSPTATPELPVVEERRALSGDVAGVVRVDLSLPQVRMDLPGAEAVNGRISDDYAAQLAAPVADFADLTSGFSYPYCHIWYEVYRFDGLYEICVLGEVYSLKGSGPLRWVSRYYYDSAAGVAVEEPAFLAAVGRTEEDILQAFMAEIVMDDDDWPYTYGDAADYYYIKEDGAIVFWSDMYA